MNPVVEALRAGRPISRILISRESKQGPLKEVVSTAKKRDILLQFVDKKQLEHLVGAGSHQGVVAQVAAKEYVDWEETLQTVLDKGEVPLFVMLDGVEDPQNLGSILRTADAAGVHCVIIPKHRAAPLTSGVAKASAGAVEHVGVARVTNLAQTIDKLKDKGFWVMGAEPGANQDYFAADLNIPLVLVMGSESKGLSRLTANKCDFCVKIPMNGKLNSLNVAVATSVILFEIVRQRNMAGDRPDGKKERILDS